MASALMQPTKIMDTDQSFLGKLYFALCLDAIGRGERRAADVYVDKAAGLLAPMAGGERTIAGMIASWAHMQTYGEPMALAQNALKYLPATIDPDGAVRRGVLGKLHIAQAFLAREDNAVSGTRVRRLVLKGVRYDPSYVMDRGVVSVFFRSFLGRHRRFQRPPQESDAGRAEVTGALRSAVQAAVGSSVESFERINTGDSGSGVFLLNVGGRQCVLRLVPSDLIELKVAVLERVRALGIPVPAVLAWGSSTAAPGPGWILDEWMPGDWFEPYTASHDELGIVAALGRYLRKMNTIQTSGFGPVLSQKLDAPYASFSSWLDSKQGAIVEACLRGVIPGTVVPALGAAYRFVRESYGDPPVLCHCELGNGNLLVEGGRLTAIIDWNSASGGDPAYDLAILLKNMSKYWYPERERAIASVLLEAYSPDEPESFLRRILAHRLLLVAAEIIWLTARDGRGSLAFESIMAQAGSGDWW